MINITNVSAASFRDPAGFVFFENDLVKRAITIRGKDDHDLFIDSGLYAILQQRGWIVPHVEEPNRDISGIYKIITPEKIPVWTYPYEWCFSQLKDAAILTLEIQLLAVQHGLSLKDATPFNIQFSEGKPIFIDTLSFERFREQPWFGYRQFCEMFLAPLALMAEKRMDFNRFLAVDLNGIPLGFASRLLPLKTWFRFGYLTHLHLHAASQSHFEGQGAKSDKGEALSLKFPKSRMISLIDTLLSCIKGIRLKAKKTAFSDYYGECAHYSREAEDFKIKTVGRWAQSRQWGLALDLGGNAGKYSRILTKLGVRTVCADSDPYCVDQNYLNAKKENDSKMLPMQLDLTNPTPDLGWANEERTSLSKRLRPELVLCLALIHHLRISAGIPLALVARHFAAFAPHLIIEFVPKGDPMVTRLLKTRDDIFFDYDIKGFEAAFGGYFNVEEKVAIPSTNRTLYFLIKK